MSDREKNKTDGETVNIVSTDLVKGVPRARELFQGSLRRQGAGIRGFWGSTFEAGRVITHRVTILSEA